MSSPDWTTFVSPGVGLLGVLVGYLAGKRRIASEREDACLLLAVTAEDLFRWGNWPRDRELWSVLHLNVRKVRLFKNARLTEMAEQLRVTCERGAEEYRVLEQERDDPNRHMADKDYERDLEGIKARYRDEVTPAADAFLERVKRELYPAWWKFWRWGWA